MKRLFPEYTPEDKRFLFLVVSLIVLASFIIQILLYYRGFFSFSADESGRTILAYQWLKGIEPAGEPWLPFHKIVNGLALKIYPNLFITPRLVGTFFAVLSAAVFVFYSFQLFKKREITWLASLMGLFFPPFVIIRAVPLTESMFIFFILSGSLIFLKWLDEQKQLCLFTASFLFALSGTVRYEGWLFSFCIIIYSFIIREKTGLPGFLFVALLSAGFPIYWIAWIYIKTGDPVSFISSTSGGYTLHHDTFFMLLKYNLITQFAYQNIQYLNFGGFISLIFFTLIDKKIRPWIIITFSAFMILASLSFAQVAMPSHAFWRIPLIWNILLIPFSAHFIYRLSEFLKERYGKTGNFFVVFISSVLILYFFSRIESLTGKSSFTADEKNAGRFINSEIAKGKNFKVLIDSSGWEYLNIYVASNDPDIFLTNSGDNPHFPERAVVDPGKPLSSLLLKKLNIKYLLFEREDYKKLLNESSGVKPVRRFGVWNVYTFRQD